MRKKIILLILTFLWIGFIFYNSLQSVHESSAISSPIVNFVYNLFTKINIEINYMTLSFIIRKCAHIFEYMVLGILFTLLFFETNMSNKYCLLYAFLVSILVSITDEIIQTFVTGRSGAVVDVGFDTIGIALGIGIVIFIQVMVNKRIHKK